MVHLCSAYNSEYYECLDNDDADADGDDDDDDKFSGGTPAPPGVCDIEMAAAPEGELMT